MTRFAAAALWAASALGWSVRRGLVGSGHRRLHHGLYLVGSVATGLAVADELRRQRRRPALLLAAAGAALARLPGTRGGSRRHLTTALTATALATAGACQAGQRGSDPHWPRRPECARPARGGLTRTGRFGGRGVGVGPAA